MLFWDPNKCVTVLFLFVTSMRKGDYVDFCLYRRDNVLQTRGYKVIVRMMPHEVSDLEPLLALLALQSPSDFEVSAAYVSCPMSIV